MIDRALHSACLEGDVVSLCLLIECRHVRVRKAKKKNRLLLLLLFLVFLYILIRMRPTFTAVTRSKTLRYEVVTILPPEERHDMKRG